jgi:hypothetical protein
LVPLLLRGVSRSSQARGGMRWTRAAPKTRACACGRRSRVVLTPRRRRQVCGGNSAGDGDKQARSPGSTKETVKTIARGMPGETGVTVVTCSCAFFICTRGCGRIERPAFPAPSDVQMGGSRKTRAHRAAGSRSRILSSLRGAKRRSNPFFLFALWIASLRSQ